MTLVPHKHTTKVFETPIQKYRDYALIAPAKITGGKDTTKFGQKIEIKQYLPEFVAQEIDAIIDTNSLLSHGVKRCRANNQFKADKLYITPIQDNILGVQATATIIFNGTVLSSAVSKQKITSMSNKLYSFDFASGTTVANIATAVANAINNNTSELFTATASTNIVTLTAVNAGPHRNGQPMNFSEFNLPGIDVIFSGFAGGASGADISAALSQYDNDSVNIIVPWDYAEQAIEHVKAKHGEIYTDAQKSGVVITDSNMSLFDIAQSERIGNGYCVIFANKAEVSKLPTGVDGTYGASAQLDSFLAVIDAYSLAIKKNQDGENTGRPAEDDYGIIGGVNQYLRTFNGTPLPTTPVSPYASMTSYTMSAIDQILIEKGYSFSYLDKLGNLVLSQLYISDASLKDNPRRTLCQYDIAEFLIQQLHDVLQGLAKLQQSKLKDGFEAKIRFLKKADELVEQYPTIWLTADMLAKQKSEINKMMFEISNSVAFVTYSLVIDDDIRRIESTATLYSQAQLS